MPNYGPPDAVRMELHVMLPVEYDTDEVIRLNTGVCFKPDTLWLVWRRLPLDTNGRDSWYLREARAYGQQVERQDHSRLKMSRQGVSWSVEEEKPIPEWADEAAAVNDPNDIVKKHVY